MDIDSNKVKKGGKTLLKVLAWVVGICVVIMIVLQIVLSPTFLTKIVNNVADDYIDGELKFGRVSASVIRNFPYLNVALDSVTLTYPTQRYAEYESGAYLLKAGKGEVMDTLAKFDHFSLSLNLWSLIGGGVNVPLIELDGPRIFAKNYGDDLANWNIFKTGGEDKAQTEEAQTEEAQTEEADTVKTSTELPKITLERIRLEGKPVIVYCSKPDTLYASLRLKGMNFKGHISTRNLQRTRIGFKMDSLFVAGRYGKDTVALGLDLLGIRQRRENFSLDLHAKAALATRMMGRMRIPIDVSAKFSLPKDTVPAIDIKKLEANLIGIPLKAEANVRYLTDSIWIDGRVGIDECKVKDVINFCGKNIMPELEDLETSAKISMDATINGWLNTNGSRIPAIDLTFSIPDSQLKYDKFKLNTNLGIELWAKGGGNSPINVGINDLHLNGDVLQFNLTGSGNDLLGKDPLLGVDAEMSIAIDSLSNLIYEQLGMAVAGTVSAKAKGKLNVSQMTPYRFAEADIVGFVRSDYLALVSEKDSIDMHIDSLNFIVGTLGNQRDTTIEQGTRLMTLGMKIDSTYVKYKEAFFVSGKDLGLRAWNDAAILDPEDSSSYYPFSGNLDIGRVSVMDSDSSCVTLKGSASEFKISPSSDDKEVPVLTMKSSNDALRAKLAFNRASIRNLNLNITAAQNGIKRKKKAKTFVDSIAREYPDVPRDSLFQFLRANGIGPAAAQNRRNANPSEQSEQRSMPDWLTEEDFRKSDLNLKLDDVMAQYYRDWDFDGRLTIKRASLMTPLMPLRNSLNQVDLKVDNNTIALNSFTLKSGNSNLTASGRITGLRSALLRNGPVFLNLYVNSDSLNVNELLTAYDKGSQLAARLDSLYSTVESMDDDAYMDLIAIDTIANTETPGTQLFIIPANLIAEVTIDAADVKYSLMEMDAMHAEITMKERCIQVVNTLANSNVGGLSLEAFYSTRTKEDLSAGFNLTMSEITADKIIEMMPAIDTLMPMLTSFHGLLNCELAATTQIDTSMNIVLPSLSGVMRIGGRDLALVESEDLYKIARLLRFKHKENIIIDDMSVEALISDSKVEIFPFVLNIDRYSMALSGIQNLDQSFSYHISVLKSPLLIRFGLNLRGNDFDSMKWRLGKAKYKSTNVPVFSSVIDETKVNLSDAIKNIFSKGVNAAIAENRQFSAIAEKKEEIGYVNPAEEELEELSDSETQMLDSEEEEAAE